MQRFLSCRILCFVNLCETMLPVKNRRAVENNCLQPDKNILKNRAMQYIAGRYTDRNN